MAFGRNSPTGLGGRGTLAGGTFSGVRSRDGKSQVVMCLKVDVRWDSLSGAGAGTTGDAIVTSRWAGFRAKGGVEEAVKGSVDAAVAG